jgi:hypothetical protein
MLFPGIVRFFNKIPPAPSYHNVIPTGRGWYRWSRDTLFGPHKWRRCEVRGFDPAARWLSDQRLLDFVLDAIRANRGMRKRRVRIIGGEE